MLLAGTDVSLFCSILFYSFYSILFYSILFYSILFYSILLMVTDDFLWKLPGDALAAPGLALSGWKGVIYSLSLPLFQSTCTPFGLLGHDGTYWQHLSAL